MYTSQWSRQHWTSRRPQVIQGCCGQIRWPLHRTTRPYFLPHDTRLAHIHSRTYLLRGLPAISHWSSKLRILQNGSRQSLNRKTPSYPPLPHCNARRHVSRVLYGANNISKRHIPSWLRVSRPSQLGWHWRVHKCHISTRSQLLLSPSSRWSPPCHSIWLIPQYQCTYDTDPKLGDCACTINTTRQRFKSRISTNS